MTENIEHQLAACLKAVQFHDTNYVLRTGLVIKAMHLADRLGMQVGCRIDPKEPDWPVAFVELPTGQVSWHMPAHCREWDGHTSEEKMQRLEAYVDAHLMEITR